MIEYSNYIRKQNISWPEAIDKSSKYWGITASSYKLWDIRDSQYCCCEHEQEKRLSYTTLVNRKSWVNGFFLIFFNYCGRSYFIKGIFMFCGLVYVRIFILIWFKNEIESIYLWVMFLKLIIPNSHDILPAYCLQL